MHGAHILTPVMMRSLFILFVAIAFDDLTND